MTLQSMTGFARATGQDERHAWAWEGRSVNAKGLDIRCRVPSGLDGVEQAVKAVASKRFRRGNISFSLSIERRQQGSGDYRINRGLLDQVRKLRQELSGDIEKGLPTLEGLLAVRGMLELVEEEESPEAQAARERAIVAAGEEMIAGLAAARDTEGGQLGDVLAGQLEGLAELVDASAQCAAAQPDAIRVRLQAMVAELLDADPRLPEERLAQEAALLAGKADVREELDRLRVHIATARDLLADGSAVGRRLDFLCQELNREANTLCSKSADVTLTQIGLDMKATIEQFREQVQNVE